MRIREDGKHAHRSVTIERAAEFWDCNKTTTLMKIAEFARRADASIKEVLERDGLTTKQKRDIAEAFNTPNYKIRMTEELNVSKD